MSCPGPFRPLLLPAILLALFVVPSEGRTLAAAARGIAPAEERPAALDLPTSIRTALHRHPALMAARAIVARRRAGLDDARAQGRPNVSLSADFSKYRRAHVLNPSGGFDPAMRQTLAEADAFERLFGRGPSSYLGSGVADLGADFQTFLSGAAAGAGFPGDIAGYFDSLVQSSSASLGTAGGEIGLQGERVGRARVGLEVPLLSFGRLEGLRQEAGARIRVAEADLEHLTLAVAHAVVQRYLDAHLAWNLMASFEEEMDRLEALAEVATRSGGDEFQRRERTYRLEVALSRSREAWERSRGALAQAETALQEAIGLPRGETPPFHFMPPDFRVVQPSEEEALRLALRHRHDHRRELSALAALRGALRHARAQGRPNVHLSGEVSTFRDDADFPNPDPRTDYRLMVGGTIPLFDGGRCRSRSKEVSARIREQEARIRELENRIRSEVRGSLQALAEGERRSDETWRGLEAARAHADVLGRAFETGRCPFERCVEGQQELAQARVRFHRAVDLRDRAITALSRTLGLPNLVEEAGEALGKVVAFR